MWVGLRKKGRGWVRGVYIGGWREPLPGKRIVCIVTGDNGASNGCCNGRDSVCR